MNFCPECGCVLDFDRLVEDIPTHHHYFICMRGGHKWEETTDKSGKLLHISSVNEEQEGGEPNDKH